MSHKERQQETLGPCKDLGSMWRRSQCATMQGKAVLLHSHCSPRLHPTPIPGSRSEYGPCCVYLKFLCKMSNCSITKCGILGTDDTEGQPAHLTPR